MTVATDSQLVDAAIGTDNPGEAVVLAQRRADAPGGPALVASFRNSAGGGFRPPRVIVSGTPVLAFVGMDPRDPVPFVAWSGGLNAAVRWSSLLRGGATP